ncbi:MAG TPA: ParB/RepB/Spo0J family partition protein [Candidatus Dormibacteraeota bacterium]|nr:ParB/RepB/Spo0J family partition protein [Candidatus Dormibacteraeota bacterium]
MNKRRGLGRGLEALIPSGEYVEELGTESGARRRYALQIPIADIKPNPEQPRRMFDPTALQELADSIRMHGILQPLLVREGLAGYELIAGERRLRAAEIAGLAEVPVIVHPGSGGRLEERLELALVENLQRTDLNAIEEARAIQRLLRDFGLTQEALGERIGKNRVTIAQSVRLLGLPEPAVKAIESNAMTAGHGIALLGLATAAQQLVGLERVVREHWSVRQTEDWVRARATEAGTRQRRRPAVADPESQALEEEFRRALGTKVILTRLKHGGRLTIEFYSNEEFEALRRRLTR